jgi:hypothetical protein
MSENTPANQAQPAPPTQTSSGWLGRALAWPFGDHGWKFYLTFAQFWGFVFLLLFTLSQDKNPISKTGVGLLIAGAASAVGILTGFLFGIPRTAPPAPANQGAPAGAGQISFGVNTNLEQISDWLTKIIVGVGLVQLTILPEHLMSMVAYLSTAFGDDTAVPPPVVGVILTYFSFIHFLLGYLWTRLFLTEEFSRVERAARDRPAFFEGAIHALLYQPGGYTEAIKRAEEYEQYFGDNERVYMYKAMAYAQLYTRKKAEPASDAELKQIKNDALQATKLACVLNKDVRPELFRSFCWKSPGEDDLNVFRDDPDFQDLFATELQALQQLPPLPNPPTTGS